MQHVHALVCFAVLLALVARELDAARDKEGAVRGRVGHLDQPRVEVDLRRQGGDGDQRGISDAQDGRDRLVEETFVAVRGLLEDQNVAAGPLGGSDLLIQKM